MKPIDFQAFYSRHLVLFFNDFLGAMAGNKFMLMRNPKDRELFS